MTRRIPLFPLPGVVLLPGTLLPLHVFEPRYREMVARALAGDRTIGMALLAEGADPMAPLPPIVPIGGAGEIVRAEQLEDGRYNIVLQGAFRYRVLEEEPPAPYRVARVEPLASVPFDRPAEEERSRRVALRLFDSVRSEMSLPPLPDAPIESERLASELALRMRYGPSELQALLETDSIRTRLATVVRRMRHWRHRLNFLAPFRPSELEPTRN